MFNRPVNEVLKSKGMIAGLGLVGFGAYLIYKGNQDFGYAMLLNGLGILGIRDAQ